MLPLEDMPEEVLRVSLLSLKVEILSGVDLANLQLKLYQDVVGNFRYGLLAALYGSLIHHLIHQALILWI